MSDRIVELGREDEFEALAARWDACLATRAQPALFLTSAWLLAWWQAFGAGRRLRIVAVLDAQGEIRAAAPLVQRSARYYRVPVREATFLGDGTSDRQEFLVRAGEEAALEALWVHLREAGAGAHLLRLEQLPAESPTLAVGLRVCPGLKTEPSSLLPYLAIAGDWEAYEARLSSKFCRELRNRPKVFASWGAWDFAVVKGAAVAGHLDAIAAVETLSAKAVSGYAFLADPANLAFVRGFLGAAPAGIEPWLSLLRVDGRIVAYLLGFVQGGVYHAYNQAYAPGHEKGSPGKWVFHRTIQQAFADGLAGFDFLRGESYVKSKWRPVARANARAVLFYPGLRGRCLATAVFVVRPWLKRRRAPDGASGPAADPAD